MRHVEIQKLVSICRDLNKLSIIREAEYISLKDIGHHLRIEFSHGTVCLYKGLDEINFIHRYFTQNGFT